ncbi:hypothetical protein PSP6_830010 [Paraburkholderia tropica]|nr:hypothetical protein PSP6_830010 [Paraburkholderia tropica]
MRRAEEAARGERVPRGRTAKLIERMRHACFILARGTGRTFADKMAAHGRATDETTGARGASAAVALRPGGTAVRREVNKMQALSLIHGRTRQSSRQRTVESRARVTRRTFPASQPGAIPRIPRSANARCARIEHARPVRR